MKIITWNVNSIRIRLERLLGILERHQPDLVCLQETKVPDDQFPAEGLAAVGYHSAVHGQKGGYNGVALISREPLAEVERGFAGDPIPEQARVISATLGGVRVICAYVVNGQAVGSEKFAIKLRWLDALSAWIDSTQSPERPLVLAGDFNIAPQDRDTHDPELWRDRLLCSEQERSRLFGLYQWGLVDLFRSKEEAGGRYSWWDYRAGAFHRDHGLRIDLILGTPPIVAGLQEVTIDRQERHPKTAPSKPSDHAPVIATFAER